MALETVSVIGGGAWGTALAQAAAMAGRSVTLVVRDTRQADEINSQHTNARFLGAQKLRAGIKAVTTTQPADIIILALPAQATRAVLTALDPALFADRPVIVSAK
ncbi:MAG TPA: 2-dehydropantoate 2-reductase N-terminal domain-containing protein, partial [Devosia sp.]|nr:2-dehydropantoate 2-reductase N-terminal domain-containing protein [Devosia sp.]